MLRYSRHVHVEAEGSNIQIVRTGHYSVDEGCESSVLYQHVMLGAQNEFQNWLKQSDTMLQATGQAVDGSYARRQIVRTAAKWTKDLSTEVLLLLAADDITLAESLGAWPVGQPVIEIIRSGLTVDIQITLSILWVDTNRDLLSRTGE